MRSGTSTVGIMSVMRLVGADVRQHSEFLEAIWTWDGQVPTTDTVLWSVLLTGSGRVRQVGHKILDTRPIAPFVFDHGRARQENLPVDREMSADQLIARFPTSVLDGLGQDWTWRAVLTVAGRDVGEITA